MLSFADWTRHPYLVTRYLEVVNESSLNASSQCITGEKYLHFVPSELNVADDGIRGVDTRRDVLVHEQTRAALNNEGPLFPEHLLDSRLMRGVPRGSASAPLVNAFKSPQEMVNFLQEALETPPSLNRDDK